MKSILAENGIFCDHEWLKKIHMVVGLIVGLNPIKSKFVDEKLASLAAVKMQRQRAILPAACQFLPDDQVFILLNRFN